MKADFLKHYYQQIIKISDEDWEVLCSRLVVREFARGEKVVEIGKTENYISFVQEGVCRSFYHRNNEEHTLSFSFPGDFACAYLSFLKRSPSFLAIQALTPVVVWSISYSDMLMVYRESGVGNYIGRTIAEGLYIRSTERLISFMADSAEKRYAELLQANPELIQHIPLKYIASYIGITPQALSRIRRSII